MNKEQLIQFLCEAKQTTYARNNGENNSENSDKQSKKMSFSFEKENLLYVDTCLGTEQIVGEEAVWEDGKPVWAMNYTGREVAEGFDLSFLREALRRVKEEMPYRGPKFLELGEYTYRCRVEGEFEWFVGCEKILYKGVKVYEAMFQGGLVK